MLPATIDKRELHLTAFDRYLGRPYGKATQDDVEDFLDARRLTARTRYTWISHLHCFYEWGIGEGELDRDPTARIVRPRLRRAVPRPARTDQLEAALAGGGAKHRAWIVLAALEGLRCQEIAGLRREDVLEAEKLLRIVHGKGGTERLLPLHDAVLTALEALPMPRTGWIFTRPLGGRYTPATLSIEFNEFLRDAGVTATAHQLRHWFGTHLYARSHDLRLVQEMLGHASPTTTSIYVAFDRTEAARAVQALTL